MAVFLQNLVGGLAAGSLYALAALGLVLIFKTTRVVNFAQGEMAMFSTFIAYTLLVRFEVHYLLAALVAVLFAGLLGMAVERLFMRPLQGAPILSPIILSLGLLILLNGLAGLIWDYEPFSFPAPVAGAPWLFGEVAVARESLAAFGVATVLMAGLYLFFTYTRVGLAMRAAAQRLDTARLMGVPVGLVFSLTWAFAAVLAAVAGLFIAPKTGLDPNFMGEVAIKAFAAAIIGGFESPPGAIIGGLTLGVLENLVAGYISTELKAVFSFTVILLVLILRPEGLLGRAAQRRV